MNVTGLSDLNQYLTFCLEEEVYAFDISRVQSVLDFDRVTKVPKTPDYMRGVINLRGSVVPIVDMKLKFGMSVTEKTQDTCIIIVEVELDNEVTVIGCMADSVQEVIDLLPDDVEPAPKMGTRLRTDFIAGMGKKDDVFIILLDLSNIFTADELKAVRQTDDRAEHAEDGKQAEKKTKKKSAKAAEMEMV